MRCPYYPLLLSLLASFLQVQAIQPLFKYHIAKYQWLKHGHAAPGSASFVHPSTIIAAAGLPSEIIEGTFTQPLDHFDGTTNLTFQQRYWYSTRHYKSPSQRATSNCTDKQPVPIFVLEGGETSGINRLDYLDYGIIDILARATGGIGVVLEHRYYGKSHPPRSAFGPGSTWTVDELRWLNNRQAEEDSARFVKHLNGKFRGVQEELNATTTPIITYGGSYAGARSASLRVRFPDLFWGAIASSAVTAALEEFPQYTYGIARGNNVTSIQAIQAAVASIDAIIAPQPSHQLGLQSVTTDVKQLQGKLLKLANLEGLSDLGYLAELMMYPLGEYQSVNWDDSLSPPSWVAFLRQMASNPDTCSFKDLKNLADELGLSSVLPDEALRLLDYIRNSYVDPCRSMENGDGKEIGADACFASNWKPFIENEHLNAGKAWSFQVCTEWGFFLTSPPPPRPNDDPNSPFTYLPGSGPKLVSSLIDLNRSSEVCREGFPDGKYFKIPPRPDVSKVNYLGGFAIEADRLAFVDGEFDPWREATPHSDTFAYGGARPNTLSRPFILIPNATHHWDENGVRPPPCTAGKGGKNPGHSIFHDKGVTQQTLSRSASGTAPGEIKEAAAASMQMPFEAQDAADEVSSWTGLEPVVASQERSIHPSPSPSEQEHHDYPSSIPAPYYIQRTHEQLVQAVVSWVEEWKRDKSRDEEEEGDKDKDKDKDKDTVRR